MLLRVRSLIVLHLLPRRLLLLLSWLLPWVLLLGRKLLVDRQVQPHWLLGFLLLWLLPYSIPSLLMQHALLLLLGCRL